MRVLFTTFASTGHLNPLLPLAHALAATGHTVAFAAAPAFCPQVEAFGFPCFPAGIDEPAAGWPSLVPELRNVPPTGEVHTALVQKHVFAGITSRHMVPDLLALGSAWHPDLIVRDPTEFGGCVAAECLGIPHATGREGFFRSPADFRATFGEPLDALRSAHGLPPDPEMTMLYRYLGFAWVPPRFVDPADYIAPVMHFVRPALAAESGEETLPPWVADLSERPTIYATLGTGFNKQPAIFAAIIAGLRDEPVNLIVTVGRDMDPAQFGTPPTNVHIERYIPQALLLPRCAAVVAHGGFGTMMGALGHGLPLVMIPISADQPRNARRCVALGVGRSIEPAAVTAGAVREAVRAVLDDPAYRKNAERMGDELAALPGPEYAVALLERLAAEKQPLLTA